VRRLRRCGTRHLHGAAAIGTCRAASVDVGAGIGDGGGVSASTLVAAAGPAVWVPCLEADALDELAKEPDRLSVAPFGLSV
jgi:hypothetical protein